MAGGLLTAADLGYTLPIISYIVVVIVIIGLAYVTTLGVAKLYTRGSSTHHIRIVERVHLAADKSLWLIELAGKYYFFYTDKAGLSQLDTLDANQLDTIDAVQTAPPSFMALLKSKMKGRQDGDNQS